MREGAASTGRYRSRVVDGTRVLVPAARWQRWLAGFEQRNGAVALRIEAGVLYGATARGARLEARAPFGRGLTSTDPAEIARALTPPAAWGVLLVRRGGFAVARMAGDRLVASKVGQRHVQGRTKAGGQSQQRFARRRANQARVAFDAAADHAARLLLAPTPVAQLVVGGDRPAVQAVLADPRLAALEPIGDLLDVGDPRRAVLERAIVDAGAVRVEVVNAPDGPDSSDATDATDATASPDAP